MRYPIVNWDNWLNTPAGAYFRYWEQTHFDKIVTSSFGSQALQLGLAQMHTLRENRITTKNLILEEICNSHIKNTQQLNNCLSRFELLPFTNSSIDLVILPHTLECVKEPCTILKEVRRVLRPEGRIAISGFNPNSLWGISHALTILLGRPWLPHGVKTISCGTMKDWLRLMDFEIDRGYFGCYKLAVQQEKWLKYMSFMDKAGARWWPILGAGYILSAVKRKTNIHLIGPINWGMTRPNLNATAPSLAT